MFKTFNMGIGMTLILGTRDVTKAQALLKTFRLKSWPIGKIVKGHKVEVV